MRGLRDTSVLVVDDSSTMRTIIVGMLKGLGFAHIDEAEDGQAALRKIKARHFSLIISDWNMAPMDGPKLLREVRRLQTANQNRFIFVNSERSYSHQTTARLEGADAFITKPFTVAQLQGKIELVLGRSRLAS